ncbi:methyl-accepting chemotaxis protein [Halorussus sp. AFM4]|uniref:methyl-accepting chemotaxis protein n=1 Tax=Halorussus sp. AFM4 TaxID=3421651 RepID=UPI003EB69A94
MNGSPGSRIPSLGRIRRSYAAKLAIALLAVIAITVAFGTLVHFRTAETVQADAQQDLTTLSKAQANELDRWLSNVERQARTTSEHPALASGDPDRIREHLSGLVEDGQVPRGVVAVHYLDTERMTFVTSSSSGMVGVSPREQGAPFATDPPSFDGPEDTYVTRPFTVSVADFPVVAVISPVPDRPNRAVVYMVNIRKQVAALEQSVDGGYTAVVDGNGLFVAHPNTTMIGQQHHGGADNPAVKRGTAGESGFMEMGGNQLMAYAPMESADWVVMVHAPKSNAYALRSQVTSNVLGLILMAVISLALIGVTVGSNTVISLRQLSAKADEMADGSLDVDLETKRVDEIGTLYASFGDMRDSLRRRIRESEQAREEAETAKERAEAAKQEAEAMTRHLEQKAEHYQNVMVACAEGDLTERVDSESRSDAMTAIGRAFNDMMGEIEQTVANVKEFADHVSAAATEVDGSADEVMSASADVNEAVQEISEGAHRQTENLQEVSGEMNNLSASAEQVASTVDSLAETSQRAAEAGEDGRGAAEEAIAEMDAVEEETEHTVEQIEALEAEMAAIGDIVEVITEIAEQTNLLALNASIEAARTGQDGDGFAVVAEEIKSLAEDSKESAAEIEQRIERIQAQTADTVEGMQATSQRISTGVETVEEAIDALERIVDHVEETNGSIQEINDATENQAESTQTVVDMLGEVASISEQTANEADGVAAAAEQQTTTMQRVGANATDLADRAAELRELLEDFEVHGETGTTGRDADPTVVSDDD